MPTVSQHYGHHAAPRTDKIGKRAGRCPRSALWYQAVRTDGAALMAWYIKAGYPGRARRRSHCARAIARVGM